MVTWTLVSSLAQALLGESRSLTRKSKRLLISAFVVTLIVSNGLERSDDAIDVA